MADVSPPARLISISVRAGEIFANREKALHWLQSPNPSLEGQTPLEAVFAAISAEAPVAECQLVGLIPRRAYEQAPQFFERAANFHASRILEERIRQL